MKCVTWKVTRCLVFIQAAAAWKLRHDGTDAANEMAGIQGKACYEYRCSDGWAPKKDHHRRQGFSDAACCDKTCALWTCGSGFASNEAYSTNVFQSNEMCCDKTCALVKCQTGFKNKGEKALALTHDECCDMTCAAFTCSGNWSQLASASSRVGSDLSTCCQPNCAMFDCKAVGLDSNPAARDRPGSNKEACCLKAAPAVPDPVAPVTPAPTTPAPVVPTCSTWKCPSDSVVPKSKLELPDPDDATCCDKKLCRDFDCIPGWRRNTGANDSPGDSKEECCTATCKAYHCDLKEGWTSNPDRSHFLASDAETCCLQTCSRHKCSENWVPKAKQDKAGETDLECCDKTCQLHFCDESAGWKTNVRAASVAANDDISCCTSTCKRHSCGPGWVLDQAKLDEEKDTDEECCKPTCSQHKCDASAGWAEDPAASNRVGSSNSVCCLPTCSQRKCGEGWVPNKLKANDAGASDEECCLKTCKLHTCNAATQLIKKPKIDEVPGATDEECCESESCKKWPDVFQEAKAGCNQTSIHDDCNNMFEKSTEDGLSIFKRCGYLLVSGQVYRCGLVGSPVQCSPA